MTEIERIKANVQGMRSDAEQQLAQLRHEFNAAKINAEQRQELQHKIDIAEAETKAYANVLHVINGGKYSV